jgi:DNA-binding transcriptional regulator GbsR (MarR family)
MTKTVEEIQNDVIHTIGEKAEKFGFSRIAGQLEGLLYVSPEPLSLDDMARKLEVSKASVSTNIRLLERWKIVKRVYHKGARKNFYEFRGNIWEIETEIAKTIAREELERFKSLVNQCVDDLNAVEPESEDEEAQVEYMRERFDELEEHVAAGEHLLELFLRQGDITPAVVKKIRIS